jgi:hypothetical protein
MPRISSTTKTSAPEYSYDFPMPTNPSLAALPTRKPSHVLHRRRSPSPTRHHIPHFPTHSPKYSPSTRAAEVSRLLDPTYSSNHPQGSGSSSSNSPLSVFVDHYGDLHDPDYRHFPVVATRPKWERGAHDDDLTEEDEDVFDRGNTKGSLRMPAVTTYTPSYAYTYPHEVPVGSPSSYASALLEEVEESPFTDETEKKEPARVTKKRRRHSKQQQHDEKESLAAEAANTEAPAPGADYSPSEYGRDDWTYVATSRLLSSYLTNSILRPTCSQSIRREWQAITLRLRFSVFRTKRKIKRRLGTG